MPLQVHPSMIVVERRFLPLLACDEGLKRFFLYASTFLVIVLGLVIVGFIQTRAMPFLTFYNDVFGCLYEGG
jgi:hypothetical protein